MKEIKQDNITVIYVNGKLQFKKCAGIIFYGEITEIDSKYLVNCKIFSTIATCCIPINGGGLAACILGIKTKKEIMKELKIDKWGESRNIIGGNNAK